MGINCCYVIELFLASILKMSLKKSNILYWILPAGFWFMVTCSFSQTGFSSEEYLKKQANKFFEDEDFARAYPLFSQLLSLYSKDPQYNYKFGTCLLFSTSNKEKAIPYIEYAAKRQNQGVDKEVFFHLGKAYHLNYRFSDAIKSYTTYKGMVSAKQVEKYDVDRQIEMCENGKRLLKNITELSVLEKKEVPANDFFRSYNLSEFNAKLIIKPDELKTSLDRKKKDASLMYLSPERNQIYYSSYGEDEKNGRDIYYVTRTSGGDLSKPTRVSDVINTKYDEDYAFLHPNGKTLYFCSKGHNSMGGYDIFKSELNTTTQTWSKPVNMDFAINTPDDDILFISDAEDKSAYFSSKRESAEGSISVYKIKLERKPLNLAIIKGTLRKNTGETMAKATITVTKILSDEVVGVFNTNESDGSYTLALPNGGKFKFSVESEGFKKSSEVVVIPNQQEIKPMKQEIQLGNENGLDKIVIKNEFDAQADSADMQLAIQYIKEKASLEVSPEEEKITTAAVEENGSATKGEDNNGSSPDTDGKKSTAPVTNKDIIDIAYQDAKEMQKDANELRRNSESAQQLSRLKNELSIQKYNEAQELIKVAETLSNQEEKIAQADRAAKLRKESETLSKESALSLTLANQMDELATAKQQQADAELKYAKDLDNAIKSGANEKKMNELLARKEELDKKSEELSASFPPDMSKQIGETQAEASKSMAKYLDIQQDVEDLQGEAKRLRSEAEKASNEGVKQNLNQQAEEMEKEAETKKKEAEVFSVSAKQKQAEADSLKNSALLTSSVMKQIQSSPETTASSSNVQSGTDIASTAATQTTVTSPDQTINQPAETTQSTAQSQNNSTATAAPVTITSPYAAVLSNRQQEAEKKTNELEKQETLAIVYQTWTDSLDNQISSLKKQADATSSAENKAQLQNKISELQSAADEKRQKASDSRNKVDNLKLQAALAAASTVSPETTTKPGGAVATNTVSPQVTGSAEPVSPENLKGAENINNYYAGKLKENEKITNDYEKKSKEQELYQDWSSSLYDESQRLRKEGDARKAEEAEKESKAKQTLAVQTTGEVTELKISHPELLTSANAISTGTKPDTSGKTQEKASDTPPVETKNPVVNTVGNTLQSETTAAQPPVINTPTTSASAIQTPNSSNETGSLAQTTQPSNPSFSGQVPASVKNKEEYIHYVALKNESEKAKKSSESQYKQAEDIQKISDQQFAESQNISRQIPQTDNPAERQKLKEKSDELDRQALKNQARSDSIKSVARNSEAEANSRRTESDLYLQSLDRSVYEEITAAAAKQTVSPVVSSHTAATEIKIETPIQAVNTPTLTASSGSTKTETAKPDIDLTDTKQEPSKTETTPPTTNQVKNITAKTETAAQPIKNETSASKTEPGNTSFQPFRPTPNSFTPFPAPSKSSAEILKYYDALFDKLEFEGTVYSASKPIPVNPPMPEGLIFKVQIGAFRNPIPQDLFKGIKPITAETTPQGLMRYTAGLFTKFRSANNAKSQVNGLGYRDAFVVAFYNGKRISMNEALARASESGENIDASSISNTSTSSAGTSSSFSPGSGTRIAVATDVKSVNGLFYTVQIGVFSKPVNSVQLYDISPLNSELTGNGFIRYTTGRFDDEAKATSARNIISQKGITDAFVVAYRDGKRISLTSAKSIIDSEGRNVLAKQENTFIPSDTTTSETSGKSLTDASNLGIVFKVQVGAFREQVPIGIANRLLANSNRGIKTFRDENGLMIYTVGEFLEYESANSLKKELVAGGLADAFVIAFKNGKKMTASAALELIKNR